MVCSVDTCPRPAHGRGMCRSHYMKWRRHGDPRATPTVPTSLQRFFGLVDVTSDCWHWRGTTTNGYGQFRVDGRTRRAHRWLYEQLHGDLPRALDLDHLCRERACVNPDHLEPVTRSENLRRGNGAAVSLVCRRGHWKLGENLYVIPGKGHRVCVQCLELSHG